MVKEITTYQEFVAILGNEKSRLVVIDFWAQWCGPCVRIGPIFIELEKKYPSVRFYKVNVDMPAISVIISTYNITAMPSFCFFLDGKFVEKIIGANVEKIEEAIRNNLPSTKKKIDKIKTKLSAIIA